MTDPLDQSESLPACPACGDPGWTNVNDGRRYCANAGCEYTDELLPDEPAFDEERPS